MISYEYGSLSPLQNQKKLSERFNGNWNGEEMDFTCDMGSMEFVGFEYQPGFYVATCKYTLNKSVVWERLPVDDDYITLRIGYFGDINKKSKGNVFTEGIQMYNSPQKYRFSSPAGEPLYYMIIRFPYSVYKSFNPRSGADNFFREIFEQRTPWYYYYPMYPEIERLVKDVFEIRKNKDFRRVVYFTRAYEIVARLGMRLENKVNEITSAVHYEDIEKMYKIKSEILSDYQTLPNVEALSQNAGMSVSKLQRTFKAVFNMPVLRFFNLQRLEEAHRRIQYSSSNLSEISYELGFSNLSHLSKAFKQQFGYAPSEVKK